MADEPNRDRGLWPAAEGRLTARRHIFEEQPDARTDAGPPADAGRRLPPCRAAVRAQDTRHRHGGRRDHHDDRRVGRACPAPRDGARHARHQRRRAGRHVLLEHRAAPRALLRGPVHRPGAAHAQHPAVPRAAGLHRQPRAGRGRLRRPLAGPAARAAGRQAGVGAPLHRDRRRRRRRGPGRVARLRDPARRHRAVRRHVQRRGREHRRRDVLHLGHHRQPQGRRLLAPLGGAALADHVGRRRVRLVRTRRRAARRPDVPRQRVGSALRLPARGREHGSARPAT